MNTFISVIVIGVGATAVMDIWSFLRKLLLNIALPNWGLVGRWVAYLSKGRFFHESIKKAKPVVAESLIGWCTHYLVGILFAALMLFISGQSWLNSPTLLPALTVGVATVLAPFLLMQPGMGAGVASSKTPKPWAARVQSLITHFIFGFGLYLSALVLQHLKNQALL